MAAQGDKQSGRPVTAERWRQIEQLLLEALERTPTERAEFLDRQCGEDLELRREVESLLASERPAQNFLETNAFDETTAPLNDADYSWRPKLNIGPYSTHEKLGSGGMGEVYLAHDIRLGRKVALKLLDPSLSADTTSRLFRIFGATDSIWRRLPPAG